MINSEFSQVYLKNILNYIPKLLSWQDREVFSKTYGCFDRTYWCWKFTDFSSARFQEGVYALSFLYTHNFQDNTLYKQDEVLNWIKAGFEFWQKLQNKDGSFNEAYPNEHSFAATSFTLFYLGEAFLLIEDYLNTSEKSSFFPSFIDAANWLMYNDEYHGFLSNHLAAAAAALYTIYRITKENRYKKRCKYFLNLIYKHQSTEGWYEEYGGADLSYQSYTIFFLSYIWQFAKDDTLFKSLKKSVHFLKYFVHPNGTIGGEYGSRNAEIYFPAGLEILAPVLTDSALIAKKMRINCIDIYKVDNYNFLPILNNYLFAAKYAYNIDKEDKLPYQQIGEWLFSEAGLFIKSTELYYAIFGLSKGSVLRIYKKENSKLIFAHCGYWAKLKRGKVISSQHLQIPFKCSKSDDAIEVQTAFFEVPQKIFTPLLFVFFRIFSITFCHSKKIAYWLKNLLVKLLIYKKPSFPLWLTRRILFHNDKIEIVDHIQIKNKKNIYVETLQEDNKFSTVHMGSSRYFHKQEMDYSDIKETNLAKKIKKEGKIVIKRTIQI